MTKHFLPAIGLFLVVQLPVRADDFKVTVVAILASDRHTEVNPKLKQIAEEFRKRNPSLTGWKIENTTTRTIKLNQKEQFPLIGDLKADITVLSGEDKDKNIRINIKAPHAGEVTYANKTEKYFPVWTRYQTDKDKDRLLFAVSVKQIPAKEKEKEAEKGKTPDKPSQ